MPGAASATPRHCLSVFRAASRKARLNRNNSTDHALLGISCEQCNARFLPCYPTIADTIVVAPPPVKEPSSAKDRTPATTKYLAQSYRTASQTCPTFPLPTL